MHCISSPLDEHFRQAYLYFIFKELSRDYMLIFNSSQLTFKKCYLMNNVRTQWQYISTQTLPLFVFLLPKVLVLKDYKPPCSSVIIFTLNDGLSLVFKILFIYRAADSSWYSSFIPSSSCRTSFPSEIIFSQPREPHLAFSALLEINFFQSWKCLYFIFICEVYFHCIQNSGWQFPFVVPCSTAETALLSSDLSSTWREVNRHS